jgi:hypothetical protein
MEFPVISTGMALTAYCPKVQSLVPKLDQKLDKKRHTAYVQIAI